MIFCEVQCSITLSIPPLTYSYSCLGFEENPRDNPWGLNLLPSPKIPEITLGIKPYRQWPVLYWFCFACLLLRFLLGFRFSFFFFFSFSFFLFLGFFPLSLLSSTRQAFVQLSGKKKSKHFRCFPFLDSPRPKGRRR